MTKLLCALLGHKWTPAEATNEPGLRMVCRRCGRMRGPERELTPFERSLEDDSGQGPHVL
jgi:hypothetical protein